MADQPLHCPYLCAGDGAAPFGEMQPPHPTVAGLSKNCVTYKAFAVGPCGTRLSSEKEFAAISLLCVSGGTFRKDPAFLSPPEILPPISTSRLPFWLSKPSQAPASLVDISDIAS